ncbi:Apple-like protein [Cynara cardunculus var. scolymus]|uniref:Receptor-like serine/threonine-protein kinase n=1 Tax=Cynara cardunculus var. scolymus TaxID=59895 RepID=A0A103XWT3_CYNCS|nr:Apple-like protein [Cynara cardunculus var. scolymus]
MAGTSIFFVIIMTSLSCYFFSKPCYSVTDTLEQGRPFKDWDELVSSNKVFVFKFFSFGTSIRPYLGVFYYRNLQSKPNRYSEPRARWDMGIYNQGQRYEQDIPHEAVWVANKNNPIPDIYSKLLIDANGKLSILSGTSTVLDLFTPTPVARNVSLTLLDNGNLVLQELYPNGSVKGVLWQSFNYPTDTLLPGMKLGVNLKTGHKWSLTSWRSEQLPADGSFTLTGDPNGTGQLFILWRGSIIDWASGPWQNGQFQNTNLQSSGPNVNLYYISNETEKSFSYLTKTYDSFPALKMYPDGQLKGSTLKLDIECSSINGHGRGCSAEYKLGNLKCREDHYFAPRHGYIYMDEYVYDESYNLTAYDCKRICWTNCSCIAFAYIHATNNRVRCKTYGQMIYNPAEAENHHDTNLLSLVKYEETEHTIKMWIWVMIVVGSLAPLVSCYLIDKRFHVRGKAKKFQTLLLPKLLHKLRALLHKLRRFYNNIRRDKKMNNELRYFTFQSILSATNKFSSTNKLGEGGFGAVYKGKLVDGQEVAVKRLSSSSAQGVKEFKNETELIVKLQHTNLVRLLGCCIEKKEKILVYEYMPNNSLDFFLFDPRKTGLLDWNNRFVIIDGIAQGLLYLHKFSRLRVIHRDLKASNILLDDYLKPKISDFGMAKLFGTNESEANTSRVWLYAARVCERRCRFNQDGCLQFWCFVARDYKQQENHESYDVEHPLNLLGLAWELWKDGRGLELMDPVLEDSCTPKEIMTCIHVGLLCVQEHAADRPTMSDVISMLTNENMNLPDPKQPAFFIERHAEEAEAGAEAGAPRDDSLGNRSINGQSISIVLAR